MNREVDAPLIAQARAALKRRSLSRKTGNAYLNHIRRFLEFCGGRDAARMESAEMRAFLVYLEKDVGCAAATRNQALCALTFFYREVFGREPIAASEKFARARLPGKLPVVFTPAEAAAVLKNLRGAPFLAAALMYGAGLRLAEALNLRVGDVDFERGEINVREAATGAKNRASVLPQSIAAALKRHLAEVKFIYEDDCLRGHGAVWLPASIKRKYAGAEREWRWQYVFPACRLTAGDGGFYRRHLAESTVQKAIGEAVEQSRIIKKAGCQTFRYSFAVRLLERHTDVRTVQNMLGHKNLKTTVGFANFFGTGRNRVRSPLDY